MKYKVGDKVKVRSDLNYEKYSEGVPFTSEMDKFKGTVLEVRKIAGGFYEMVGIPYIFTDEMLEPVEEKTHIVKYEKPIKIERERTTDEQKEELLREWCSEHDGKYYVTTERRCVVKE